MSANVGAPSEPGDEELPPSEDDEQRRQRRRFPLLLIALLAVWKVYEAIAAETVHASIAPSLYLLGLGSFAVSFLGPRSLRLLTFFAGGVLCLAAIAFEIRS
jgi:hypothetical protein